MNFRTGRGYKVGIANLTRLWYQGTMTHQPRDLPVEWVLTEDGRWRALNPLAEMIAAAVRARWHFVNHRRQIAQTRVFCASVKARAWATRRANAAMPKRRDQKAPRARYKRRGAA